MKLNLGLDSGTRFGHILNFKFRDGFTKKKLLFFWILSKLPPDLKFVTNIMNYIRREKNVMWKNFSFPCLTFVAKLKISPSVERFQMSLHDRCGEI